MKNFRLGIRNRFPTKKIGQQVGTRSPRKFFMFQSRFAEIINKDRDHLRTHRIARAAVRRAVRHHADATSHAYIRRAANRKPHTCVFTRIRPRWQNCRAADSPHALALRRAARASVWCHLPFRLMPPQTVPRLAPTAASRRGSCGVFFYVAVDLN